MATTDPTTSEAPATSFLGDTTSVAKATFAHPTDFWKRCHENVDVCGSGVFLGLLVALLLVLLVWFFFLRNKEYADSDPSAEVNALIMRQLASDPIASSLHGKRERLSDADKMILKNLTADPIATRKEMLRGAPGKNEFMENKQENPELVALLWR